jgi:phosphohistidine phosphatase
VNLFILRHASAGVRRANPVIDVKRPLDKDGKQQCVLIGNLLNALNVQFDLVVSSPLKRAVQTAAFVANEVAYDSKIRLSPALAPTATLTDFRSLLSELNGVENVLVVGHNPNLTTFLGSLISPSGRTAAIRLRKGAIARLDVTRNPASLQWMVDARIVRALGKAYTSSTKRSRRKTSRK